MENNSQRKTWETYGQSWSEVDAAKRIKLFERCLHPDCVYTDPLMQTAGYDHLSGYMAELQKNIPGVKFIVTDFKNHHDRSIAHWDMVDGNGNLIFPGASYGVYGADGRLTQMNGFFEPPNAG